MQIKVQQLQEGKFIEIEKESTPEIIEHIISKDLGFKFQNNILMWDCAYMMSDDQKEYNKGFEQRKLLESYGLL